MPISGIIPQSKSFGDSFMEGFQNSQNMINSILQNKLTPYNIELMKSQAQEAQGKASESKMMGNFLQSLLEVGQPSSGENVSLPETGYPPMKVNSGTGSIDQNVKYIPNSQNSNGMSRQELVGRANRDQAISDHKIPPMQPGQSFVVGSNQSPQFEKQNATEPLNSGTGIGPEVEIKEGDPSKKFLDRAQGLSLNGMKFTDIKYMPMEDGYERVIYPSGRETIRKVAPTAEEKAQTAIDVSNSKVEGKNHQLSAQKSIDATKDITNAASYYEKMYDLLKKNPKMGGWGDKTAVFTRLSRNPDVGEFVENTIRAQGALGHYLAQRSGSAVLGLAKTGKPDIANQSEYNIGMIKSGVENLKNFYDTEKKNYETSVGKPFPVEEPSVFKILKKSPDDMVSVHDTVTNKITKMTRSEAEKLGAL